MSLLSLKRCVWPRSNPLMVRYHDTEWGVPLYNDRKLFEFMVLDAMQAGLSWAIVLNKRAGFRKALDNFNPKKIAAYTSRDVKRLVKDAGIIRNRQKIAATITNARLFLEVQKEFGSFDRYLWQFTGYRPKINSWKRENQIPAKSAESDAMSRDLIKRGFKFVGSTICYAFMQAAGLVNDHLVDCYRYREVKKMSR